MKEKGVIYAVSGQKYVKQSRQSVRSLKDKNPHITTVAFVNTDTKKKADMSHFDRTIEVDKTENKIKVDAIVESPFEVTLYLDTDTYICSDISGVFNLSSKFNVAVTHAPIRIFPVGSTNWSGYHVEDVPKSFPEMNTGVIMYDSSEVTKKLMRDWKSEFEKRYESASKRIPDQPAFRLALYESGVRHTVLAREYNLRTHVPSYVDQKVSIIHGEGLNLESIKDSINETKGPRVYIPGLGTISNNNFLLKIIRKVMT